MTKNVMQLYSR